MKNILLIGLGRFGRHIALQLNKLGHEVMAVDINEERVNESLTIVTNAQIGDSTNTEFLRRSASETLMCASSPSAEIFKTRWKPLLC